ncbi:hypothetical protein ACEQ8H_007681 [Pleosporales sp. CAS-2024a]
MADNIEPNADLAKILATLASLQQPSGPIAQGQQQDLSQLQPHQAFHCGVQTHQSQQNFPYHQTADPRLVTRSASQYSSTPPPPKPQDRVSTPPIDPATITEWKQGLRCVSKIAQQNPDFAANIRKLMKDQEGNVKQWEAGRARLIEDHKLKRDNETTHRAALSLPGLLEGTPLLRTPEREQAELSEYDAKVYRACKAMTEAQTSSLKVLGVPFFGTKAHLILHETETRPSEPGANQKISKTQLLELQRKMLNHLIELYGD